MTIESAVNRINYTGNGAVDTYAYPFRIVAQSDLLVTVRNLSNVETTLTLTTDYTVTGVGNEGGGNVVLVDSDQAWLDADGDLLTGFVLTIRRRVDLFQETDIRNQGPYLPELHEDAFDYLTMIDQQQQDELDRSLKAPETDSGGTMILPAAAARASNFLAFDASGNPIASSGSVVSVPVSAYMATVLDDTTAAAARATLGFSGASGTVATANLDDAVVNPLKLAAASIDRAMNTGVSCSVASNALTIALKTFAGTDPSASDVVKVPFRHATAATGTTNVRSITGALSLVISSGSTLGHASALAYPIYVYLCDNAGTIFLAASTKLFDWGSVQSTTAEGGAGAADSATALYASATVSNIPVYPIARLTSTQATAGTWAAVPTEISIAPPDRPKLGVTNGSSANAGEVGEEIISSALDANITTSIASLGTIALTPGDWDVSAAIAFNGASNDTLRMVVGTTAASTVGTVLGISSFIWPLYNTGGLGAGVVPPFRVSITANTTYHLNANVDDANSATGANWSLRARRVR